MIKGITVTLINWGKSGIDDYGEPIITKSTVEVENVLIGEPSSEDVLLESSISGKRLAYVLGIPKGDNHDWIDAEVEFFGERFKTIGKPTQGIEENVPLQWNKKVKVESYE